MSTLKVLKNGECRNMNNKNGLTFGQRFKIFLKKNGFAIAVTACAVCLVVALAITAVIRTNQNKLLNIDIEQPAVENGGQEDVMTDVPKQEMTPVASDEVLTFIMPVKNYTIGTNFVNDDVVYNKTMNEWTTHEGVDFITTSPEGVVAVADGVVESVEYDSLEGTIIIIKHTEGLKSVYKSLSQNVEVSVGQEVKAGDVIGETGVSASNEMSVGNHLHFEVLENGISVNPFDYIVDK